jgi:Flp pilus assembly protein TadB
MSAAETAFAAPLAAARTDAAAVAEAVAKEPKQVAVNSSDSPLLFVFMLPMLAIVGCVLLIGQSPTWALVGLTMATIGVMTGLVMWAINRLLADGDGEGNADVVPH